MSSNLFGTLQKDFEIKASAEKFHGFLKHRPHHFSNVSDKIHDCELHEGEWGTEGSIIIWTYFHDGKKQVAKEIIEAIDDEKNSVTFRVLEGDLMEHFKSCKFHIQVTPKAEGEGSIVHWRIEYEKHHDEIIDPHTLLDLIVDVSKDLEQHLLEA